MDYNENGFDFMGNKVKDTAATEVTKSAFLPKGKDSRLFDVNGNLVEQSSSKLFGLDNSQISGLADIGSLGISAFAAYDGYKTAKLNRKALQFNLDTAKAEQARRNNNVAGFNMVTG